MLAYTAHRRPRRRLSPSALAMIIGAHALTITLVASMRMDLQSILNKPATEVVPIPLPPELQPKPPEAPQQREAELPPAPKSFIDRVPR